MGDMNENKLEYTSFTKEHETELVNDIISSLEDDYIDLSNSGHGDRYEGDMFRMLVNIVKDFSVRHSASTMMDIKKTVNLRLKFVKDNLEECPLADKDVLLFISRFVFSEVGTDRECVERTFAYQNMFTRRYCWYFAKMLQLAFDGKGDVVHVVGPDYDHFVWIYKDIPYDITGFRDIPDGYGRTHEKFMGDKLNKYKHVPDDKETETNES